jgi:DNA-binding MarR family transcriptional regulator
MPRTGRLVLIEKNSVPQPSDANSVNLSDRLAFDLYAAGRAITRAYRPLLLELGLTYPQYLVMLMLWQHAPRTVKELGESLELDSGTLSPLLKRLAASGLVTRQRRQDDERTVEITPTPKGRGLLREAASVPIALAGVMGLSSDETRKVRALLRKMAESLEKHRPDAPASLAGVAPLSAE